MRKLLLVMLFIVAAANTIHAEINIVGNGKDTQIDPSSLPPAMKANYEIFRVKCGQCHALERAITALKTGKNPISGTPYNGDAIKTHGVKLMRSAEMSKAEVKSSVELFNFLLEEKKR